MQIKFAAGVRFRRAAIIAAAAVTACVAQGCAGPTIGDTVNIADNALACINYDDLNKLLLLRRREDEEAFFKLATSAKCLTLKAGTGTVEDTQGDPWGAFKAPTACVRPKGEIDCVWTLRSYLTVITKDGAK